MTEEETFAANDKIVTLAVGRVAKRLPKHIDIDDLYSAGWVGLLEASERYDPARDNTFATYAVQRVDGAILDRLRALDWVPRSVRRASREMEAASREVSNNTGAEADAGAIAEAMGISREKYDEKYDDAPRALASMDSPVGEDDMTLSDVVGSHLPTPAKEAESRQLADLCLSVLTKSEKDIVLRHIIHGDKLREIAEDMGFTESRACQINTKAVKKMRAFAEAA